METMERKYVQEADHILAVSEFDRNFFARMTDPEKISVIPTGVDIDFFRPAKAMAPGNTLIFTGSMDWLPNEDGIIYFVEEILPKIRVKCPDVELRIVGRRPAVRLRRFAEKHAGVEVTGDVDDIRPHLHAGKVYIVPLRVGGGTRLKIFEAMAAGKAIVSTTIGAEGLPVHPGKDILLADEPNGFAEAVIELLQNISRRECLERSARNLVESRYSWRSVGETLDSVLKRIAAQN
jgi:glycosyltransferase involved in cell wall biosynthesis